LPASQPAPSASFPGGGGGGGGGIGDPLLTIDPRLMLFDADGKLLVGRDEVAASAVQKPIPGADGAVVGYLGYLPQQRAVASLERAFSGQQNRKFAALGAAMLVAGLLIAALLAHWLSRRIKRLAHGAAALIQGHYGMRLDVDGGDELAQLAQDFNQLAQTLEAAQRARQQWIADIAHELRTPLAVLRAEIEALQDGVRPLGPAGLGSLAQEVSQLTRLVEDLRMLSLSDVGALTYHKEAFDLGELVVDALGAHAHALSAKGIACAVDAAADVQVLGDADRLAQVVANLLQNTLRYTDAPGRLEVRLVVDAGRALLVWQDSSPGVPADDLPRLTERLFRVDASRSRAGGGTGLGLAITKAIVQAHGGEMVASASPLGGVRWEIAFPLIDSSARPNHG
jgi:two-component system sensor histidine kinase BaeS